MYTFGLKRVTTQNIVIGGAAGAAPVLVGWAAITGGVALPAGCSSDRLLVDPAPLLGPGDPVPR